MAKRLSLLTVVLALVAVAHGTNLTFSFSADGADCALNGDEAITFTTATIPPQHECFNLEDIFGGNESQVSAGRPSRWMKHASINWTTYNTDAFSPSRNYSQLAYMQQNDTDPQEGEIGTRFLEIFAGRNCQPTPDWSDVVIPWFGWTCQSSSNGSCSTMPFNITSFSIAPAHLFSDRGKCMVHAEEGAAPRHGASLGAVLVASAAVLSALCM